ncbi:MAG: DUF642 domain-containing protein, partial [Pirellula sp.]
FARNVISGNTFTGISIENATSTNNVIQGNYIGTDINGSATTGLGNSARGIHLHNGASNNTVGGIAVGAGNVISGNTTYGVQVEGNNNVIQGNTIGRNVGNTSSLANGIGVYVNNVTGTQIGGTATGAANIIAGSTNQGVVVTGSSAANTAILSNSIFSNGGLGIDLANDAAVQSNDTGDTDTGANALQNFPVISSAVSGPTGTTIAGSFNSLASTNFRIEFFSIPNGTQDTTNGEGRTYLGFLNVTTDGSGNASFVEFLQNVFVTVGDRVTATATVRPSDFTFGSTSEFAANVTVSSGGTQGSASADFTNGTSSSETVGGLAGNDLLTSGANLVNDGRFLNGTITGPFQTYSSGQSIGGWTVASGSADLLGTYLGASPSGGRSVDLFGTSHGTISQSLTTVIGNTYQVRYVLSANNSTTVSMQVSAAGVTQSESVTVSGAHSLANPEWQERFFTFTATSTSTNLQFQSLTGSSTGVFLADVSVTDLTAANGTDTLIGNSGNDTLIGSGAVDRLEGDDANLVYNGSFELAAGGTGVAPAGWRMTGTTTDGVATVAGRQTEGSNFYSFGGWSTNLGGTLSQTINTVAGTTYTLSFDLTRMVSDQSAGQLQVQVLDSSNALVNQTIAINVNGRQS